MKPDVFTFFREATNSAPFPFQCKFAADLPSLVKVPTGLGKTAMAIVGWLWRRVGAGEELRARTPRRLVYCLPMRVLVEQTRGNADAWVSRLRGNNYLARDVQIHVLMGGEDAAKWDLQPEDDAILIGTQDMLLSRALNRGYASAPARWPMQFGLLNNDCLWVFDEIQLMGSGLATTCQMEAFRRLLGSKDGHGCRSVWMSATLDEKWLETVDFKPFIAGERKLSFSFATELQAAELDSGARKILEDRWTASKPIAPATLKIGELDKLAGEVVAQHSARKGLTLAIVNTVQRARDLFKEIERRLKQMERAPNSVLLHSRFRAHDRKQHVDELLADPGPSGTICVSTQVVEAGVDISATTLFTELAPWASLVQRFGRCNRRGDDPNARVFWLDLPSGKQSDSLSLPYTSGDLIEARDHLRGCVNVGLSSLPEVELSFPHTHVIRRRDLIDLFDTTPDLAGNDIDIDRFVRDVDVTDVRVFWRDWSGDAPPDDKNWRRPTHAELCPAPIAEFKKLVSKAPDHARRWDFLSGRWARIKPDDVIPGQVFLLHSQAGAYDRRLGWGIDWKGPVEPIPLRIAPEAGDDSNDDDALSESDQWQTIAEHTDEVRAELNGMIAAIRPDEWSKHRLLQAARWHDLGKAHEVFQAALPGGAPHGGGPWAKAPGRWNWYSRRHFRHELASALAVLQKPHPCLAELSDQDLNLIAYLVAAHHGKVRLSIRSLPGELRPGDARRFARGIWDGDVLTATNLGRDNGAQTVSQPLVLSLEPMNLGVGERSPFVGQPSWADRMTRLRDTMGPFRLAYLEALLRAADFRASRAAGRRRVIGPDPGGTLS